MSDLGGFLQGVKLPDDKKLELTPEQKELLDDPAEVGVPLAARGSGRAAARAAGSFPDEGQPTQREQILAAGGKSLGHGRYEDDRGPLVLGWHQRREGDRWRVRHEEDGRLCDEPNDWPLSEYGTVMRRVLALNREQQQAARAEKTPDLMAALEESLKKPNATIG